MECSNGATTIRLEGRLIGPWVAELKRTWLAENMKPLMVDMRGVTAVDQSGKQLLARMAGRGASFLADMPMTKYIVERVSERSNGPTNGVSKKGN